MRSRISRTCLLATLCFLVAPVRADPATADAAGQQARRAASGWLQLERDWRSMRQEAGPVSPAEGMRLQSLRERQDARYRELLHNQGRELQGVRRQTQSRASRSSGDPHASAAVNPARVQGLSIEQRRAWEAMRLRMSVERSAQ
ncbi:hypothetical protein [uncultured Thiocystis sp.]|uniref:hypothetical protein n=1 Tax=uncultured Thiocystis sp. TaxID=1202134 RepID=UPI0025D649F5|nr:hypothetical protein [uncultured Thiocystis sp.]